MKKVIILLFSLVLTVVLMTSCTAIMGVNYDKKTKDLRLGMDKESVLAIMGDSYGIELISEEPEGFVEVLKFPHNSDYGYFVSFLDGKLNKIEKNRTQTPKEKIVIEHKE